ncbi:MAG: hypothetical protein ACXVEF_38965 [Polyangiales bacterium]
MRWLWLASLIAISCARRDETKIAPVHETKEAGTLEELPLVRSKADVETFDHKRAIVLGTYQVEPVAPHHKKGGRMTTIVLSDGTLVSRAYGWVKAETAFVNKRVRVTGVVTKGAPDPMLQSVGGPHVQPEKIELAEGESPAIPAPTKLPTPPMVSSMPGFAPHVDRWVAVTATVDSVLSTAGSWGAVILKLSDGGLVDADAIQTSEWKPLVGKTITTIGRVHFEGSDAAMGMRVSLFGAGPPCPGVEPRCGMDAPDD